MAVPHPYSTRFIARAGAAGTVLYTVPAGFRAVVRAADIYNDTSTGGGGYLRIAGTWVWGAALPGASSSAHFETFQVAMAGETISLLTGGTAVNGMVSGHLLREV